MSFDGTQPQPTQNISSGQATILNNFAFLANTAGNSTTGYYKFPNGLIMQWGKTGALAVGPNLLVYTVLSMLAFPNNAYSVQLTIISSATGKGSISVDSTGGTFTKTGFTLQSTSILGSGCYIFAIGN